MKTEQTFKNKLESVLDEYFPKNKSGARGQALMLFAMAVNIHQDELAKARLDERSVVLQEIEDLQQHVASSLAFSEMHNKDEMLSAILNHVNDIADKLGQKSIPMKAQDWKL